MLTDHARGAVMRMEARIKNIVKPILLSKKVVPRRVRFGPSKGVWMRLDRQNGLQRELGLYETELRPAFRRYASAARTVYDIGASDGYTTLQLGKLAGDGEVFAFEPSPEAVEQFRQNLELNPRVAARVKVFEVWIGATDHPDGTDRLHCRSIDSFVGSYELPAPDFVKIDVDGGELDVLAGANQTLRMHSPTVVVETHSLELEEQCIEGLRALGYKVDIVRNAWWRLLWPEFRPIEHNRWLIGLPNGDRGGESLSPD